MTRSRLKLFVCIAAAVAVAAPSMLVAQSPRPIELGIDAALVRESTDDATGTSFRVPVGRFRVGFPLSNALSLEPSIAFAYGRSTFESPTTGEDITSSGTGYELDLGLLYHFRTDRSAMQPYLRPFLGVHGSNTETDGGFESSIRQLAVGGGIGFKFPATDRLATRLELGFSHEAEDDSDDGRGPSRNSFYLAVGLSFFTR